MKSIPLANFRAGMVFQSPVYLEDDFILLSPEIPVSEKLVDDLKTWGFHEVYTPGEITGRVLNSEGKAGILQSAILDQDIKEQEGRRKAKAFYKEMYNFTAIVYERFKKDNVLNLNSISDQLKQVVDMLRSERRYLLRFSDFEDVDKDYLVSHSVKATFLALALGMENINSGKMKIPPHKLLELGICAMLHEIGMLRIPPQVYEKQGALSDKEKQLIAAHPILGYNLLKTHTMPQDILLGVLQHHERNNGTGYPQKLSENQINHFAKIVSISCSYVAQISSRPFRNSKDAHSSIMDLLTNMQKDLYDKTILNTMIQILSLYPIGCYVRLRNNCIGVVVNTSDENPRFPVVKMLIDDSMAPFQEQPLVNTSEYEELHIKMVLSDSEVNALKEKGLLNS